MDLIEVKQVIVDIKTMLNELVAESVLTTEQATIIAPAVINQVLRSQTIVVN